MALSAPVWLPRRRDVAIAPGRRGLVSVGCDLAPLVLGPRETASFHQCVQHVQIILSSSQGPPDDSGVFSGVTPIVWRPGRAYLPCRPECWLWSRFLCHSKIAERLSLSA